MSSSEYWTQREEEALKRYITEEAKYDREIARIYADMLDAVQKEIDGFYGKYAAREGINIAEAKKRVSKLDIAAYERKAKKYVKEKNFTKQANEEMRIYNATMKINRLEMLKANIGLELISGHDELEKFMEGVLQGRTEEELTRQAGILGETIRHNAQKANAIVNASFHNATFSDRIWQYQDLMREDLGRLLQTGLIQGKNPRALAKDLKKYWYGNDPKTGGGARYCMERLMRTELARVQTEAQKQSFERNGYEMYQFICNHKDGKTCSICAGLDGKHFKVDKMMPGSNAPPIHPHCRCSTAAWEDSEEYEAWLDFLDKGGTTAEWKKLKAKPKPLTKAELQEQIEDSREQIDNIKNEIYQLDQNIDQHNIHEFDDLQGLKKSEISGRISAVRKRLNEIEPISDRWYNRPERGTDEYYAWREWRRTIDFEAIQEEQMRLAVEESELASKLRKWDRYEEWQKWKKANPLDELTRRKAELQTKVVNIRDRIRTYEQELQKLNTVRSRLEESSIEYRKVQRLANKLEDSEIIERLGGGDKTQGSCSSLGFAYMGNKHGLDVLDFRDGESRRFFARNSNIKDIAKMDGVKSQVVSVKNEINGALKLLKDIEPDKQYYLAVGQHAAIVRRTSGGRLEYLELQSARRNGFFELNELVLKHRFGATKSRTFMGKKYESSVVLIDSDSLSGNTEFEKILGYINTSEGKQNKGVSGHVR